jgi:hypothetical protein
MQEFLKNINLYDSGGNSEMERNGAVSFFLKLGKKMDLKDQKILLFCVYLQDGLLVKFKIQLICESRFRLYQKENIKQPERV